MSGRFARNTIYSSIAGLFYSLGRFATTIVVARTLGVQETGVVNYVLWIVALLGAVTDLGVYASLTRYLPEVTRGGDSGMAERLTSFLFAPFAAVTAATFLAFGLIAWQTSQDPGLARSIGFEASPGRWLLVGALYAFQVMSNFVLGYLQGMQRFAHVALFAILTMSLQLTVAAVGGKLWGADGALLGYVVGCAVPALMAMKLAGRSREIPEGLRCRVLPYAAFAWASTLASAFIWARLEVAFLNHYWGSQAVGLYSVGFTLASLATQGPMLLTGGLLPYFSENAGQENRDGAGRMLATGMRLLAFAMLPMCLGTAALIPELLPLVYGQDFAAASGAAVVLVAVAGFGANMVVPFSLVQGLERSDFAFACNITGAILSVALSLLLVPHFGILGAAWARGSVQLYVLGLSFWFATSRLGFSLPFGQLVRIALAALGCAAVARLISVTLPGVLGLVVAVPMAACVYFALVRLLHAMPRDDVERLRMLLYRLPAGVQQPIMSALLRLTPPRWG